MIDNIQQNEYNQNRIPGQFQMNDKKNILISTRLYFFEYLKRYRLFSKGQILIK